MEETVVIVPYNPAWPELFEREREQIANLLGDLITGIEHFGSTSIPGLAAKPIIDMMVLVKALGPPEQYAIPLEQLGYGHETWQGQPEDHLFLRKGSPRTHHIHIVQKDSLEHRRHIAFRDYLRAHPEVAQAYAQFKQELAQKYCYDREAYTNAKTSFIKPIEAQALLAFDGQPEGEE